MFFINPFIFAGGGDFESIATVTVGSGGASYLDFTSIPSGYQHLQIRAILRSVYTNEVQSAIGIRLGSAGSLDTGSNYAYHGLYGDGASALAYAGASQSQGNPGLTPASTATASVFSASVIDILDYGSTSKAKTIRTFNGVDRNGGGQVRVTSSLWTSTSAVDTIRITEYNGQTYAQYSTAALYGVKS